MIVNKIAILKCILYIECTILIYTITLQLVIHARLSGNGCVLLSNHR